MNKTLYQDLSWLIADTFTACSQIGWRYMPITDLINETDSQIEHALERWTEAKCEKEAEKYRERTETLLSRIEMLEMVPRELHDLTYSQIGLECRLV